MPGETVEDEAFVSLVTNNDYANGALVLGYSLRRVNTTRKLVLLVAREVLEPTREHLARVWDHLEIVDLLDSEDTTNLALLTRPELGITFTKIHCWNLTQYRKCVFLDADTLVVQNCDELFDRDELSAVPDIGWPDCFNSGVFVFEPSRATYEAILEHAVQHGSFDGGDQGLLNSFFSDWRTADISQHLSFIYNMNSNASYTYAPAFQQFGRDVKIVHFIGPVKPWHHTYNPATGNVSSPSGGRGFVPHERSFLQLWWDIYDTFVHPEMRQCHDDQADDSAASDHFQPAPHFPPEHHFEPVPYFPPPQFHHEPYIPPPEPYYPPPPPPQHHHSPQHYEPPPQHYHSPPQHHEPPPQHHHSPPQHREPPPQHYHPPPQHYEPPPQHYHPPPQHHESPPQHYHPPPQHHEPPPQHYHPPPQHHEPPPQHHEPPPQHYEPPPQHHEPPPQHYEPPPQHHEPPPQHYEPPPQHHEPPPQHHEPSQHHEPPPPPPSPHTPQHGWPAETGQAHSDHQEEYYHGDALANVLADIHITVKEEELDPEVLDLQHRQAWESGEIDYRGRDKFEFILGRIQECIGSVLRDPTDVPVFLF